MAVKAQPLTTGQPGNSLSGSFHISKMRFGDHINFEPPYSLSWLPWWLSGKELTCQCRTQEYDPWVRKIT